MAARKLHVISSSTVGVSKVSSSAPLLLRPYPDAPVLTRSNPRQLVDGGAVCKKPALEELLASRNTRVRDRAARALRADDAYVMV